MSEQDSVGWQCLGATVPGSSHLRQGIPNQDSLAFEQTATSLLLSVSDGHGSPHCFRSEVGSSLATRLFISELKAFLAGSYGEDLSLVKRLAEERLPRQITRLWQTQVLAHYEANPVTDTEWQTLSDRKGPEAIAKIKLQPLLIYGATLLGIAITDNFIVTLQLGDGEILEADANGAISAVLPADERLFANETTSLCNENAWRDYRFRFQVRTGEASPIFLLLTTDGYFNSFRERSGFYQVGSDLLEMLQHDGPELIQKEMPLWLSEATAAGSGDDATLLIAWSQSGLNAWAANRQVAAEPEVLQPGEPTVPDEVPDEEVPSVERAAEPAALSAEAVATLTDPPDETAQIKPDSDSTALPVINPAETSAAEPAELDANPKETARSDAEPAMPVDCPPASPEAELAARADHPMQDTSPGEATQEIPAPETSEHVHIPEPADNSGIQEQWLSANEEF